MMIGPVTINKRINNNSIFLLAYTFDNKAMTMYIFPPLVLGLFCENHALV